MAEATTRHPTVEPEPESKLDGAVRPEKSDEPSQPPAQDRPVATAAEAGVLTVEVGRIFDVPEAWLIRDHLARAPQDTRLALDFRRTAELHDFALAVLVETLSKEAHRLELRGLGKHHQRLLRMLTARAPATVK